MTTLYAKPFHKKMRRLFCLLAALLVFAACDKPKNIPDDKLTAIVGDLFWQTPIGTSTAITGSSATASTSIRPFLNNTVSPQGFHVYHRKPFQTQSVKFTDILQAALDTLQAGGRPWFDAIARRDSVNKIAAELFKSRSISIRCRNTTRA